MDIQVGEHAVDYSQIQAKDKLSELQLRIRQLLDQVEQITKEQNYQRVRSNPSILKTKTCIMIASYILLLTYLMKISLTKSEIKVVLDEMKYVLKYQQDSYSQVFHTCRISLIILKMPRYFVHLKKLL